MTKATFCIFILSVSLCFHGSVLGGDTLPNGSYRQSCGNCMLIPHLWINDVLVENVLRCACLTNVALKDLGGGGPKEWLDEIGLKRINKKPSTKEKMDRQIKLMLQGNQYVIGGLLLYTNIPFSRCVAIKNVNGSLKCELRGSRFL